MKNYRNSTIFRASRLISEAFDLDDPMNSFDMSSQEPAPEAQAMGPVDLADGEDDEQTYDVDVANPVCPCCGARLNIVDSKEDEEKVDLGDIEVMDPSLEPESNGENEDAYVSIDDLGDDEEEDDEDDEEDSESESEPEDDEEEESGEKVEAF